MRRALFAVLIALSLIIGVTTPTALAVNPTLQGDSLLQTGPYVTANGAVNVRGGPGPGFFISNVLTRGEIVPVLGISPDGGWWYVNTSYGTGWVAVGDVTATSAAGVAVRDPGPIGTVIAGILTVREGAGPYALALGQLGQGQQVLVTGQNADGSWLQITWAYGTGWVSGQYISLGGGVPAYVPGAAPDGQGGGGLPTTIDSPSATVNAAYLNMRSGPGAGYTIIGFLTGGDTVAIIGRSEDSSWYQVQTAAGATGWVSALYLITYNEYGGSPVTGALPNAAPAVPVGIVNTGALNIRTGPGAEYTSLGTLAGGEQGNVIGHSADWGWYLMETRVGTGWASSRHIILRGEQSNIPYMATGGAAPQMAAPAQDGQGGAQVDAAPVQAAPQPVLIGPIAFVATGTLNIRSGPNSVFLSIGTVNSTTRMPIIGQSPDRGWWCVQSPFGSGWVSKLYILVEGDTTNVPVVQ